MNPKIAKLREEQQKISDKIDTLKARYREIDQKILKLENDDIVGMVRDLNMTPEQLAAFLAANSGGPVRKEASEDVAEET